MSMTKYLIIIIGIIVIGVCILAKVDKWGSEGENEQQAITGDYKLVAKYDPLHLNIYIRTDTATTNKFPDYIISEGDKPMYYREATSNGFAITYAEKGLDVLDTYCDKNGTVLRRVMTSYYDNSPYHRYVYVDKNGDGLFDMFILYGKDGQRMEELTRSNLYWMSVWPTSGGQ